MSSFPTEPESESQPFESPQFERPDLTVIRAASRNEAMDWALVLVSQDVEPTIVCSPEGSQWGILVDKNQHEAARNVLDLYIDENQLRTSTASPELQDRLIDWSCLLWGIYIVAIFAIDVQRNLGIREAGMMDSEAVALGEWWRLFTAVSLHADIDHLVSNLISGTLLLGLAMARFGAGNAVLGGWLSGVAGNLVGYFVYGAAHRGLGASGMVFGLLGLLSMYSLLIIRQHRKLQRRFFTSLFAGAMLFVLMALNPATDIIAHAGGFVSGCLIGMLMTFQEKHFSPKSSANLITSFFFMITLAVTWGLALR